MLLYELEKGVLLLTAGNAPAAIEIFRRCRDELDDRFSGSVLGYFAASLSDDTFIEYEGADYEHIMVRVMLCLADMVAGGTDAYAYALQIGEAQDRLLASERGKEVGYQPRSQYRRLAVGAYLQAVLREASLDFSEAEAVYTRMLSYQPDLQLGRDALERLQGANFVRPGHGVLHVFYLAGQGPTLYETYAWSTTLALRIAGLAAALVADTWAPLGQAQIPVPALLWHDLHVPGLRLQAAGVSQTTLPLLDVNRVAEQQLEANMPMIMARALVRRAVKTAVTTAGEIAAKSSTKDEDRAIRLLIELGALFTNLLWTSAERADTRLWGSLPAEIQAARLELPAGVHMLELGDGSRLPVRIGAGQSSTLVLVRPDLGRPGEAHLDRYSRVSERQIPLTERMIP